MKKQLIALTLLACAGAALALCACGGPKADYTLTLEGNDGSTGMMWNCKIDDEAVLSCADVKYDKRKHETTLYFNAEGEGITTVTLEYARDCITDIGIVKVFKFNVDSSGAIEADQIFELDNHISQIDAEGWGNSGTGFTWTYAMDDPNLLKLSESGGSMPAEDDFIAGGPISETFGFTALKEGSTALAFTYERPWEGGETLYTFRYLIETTADGNGGYSFYVGLP